MVGLSEPLRRPIFEVGVYFGERGVFGSVKGGNCSQEGLDCREAVCVSEWYANMNGFRVDIEERGWAHSVDVTVQ